ncbi:hypothetical protein [Flagellimonas sp.]|uniref:hypothetical protein n=1 Tax=Flagellimonas sp. TaxID=2058762 RepID=UPI003B5A31AC
MKNLKYLPIMIVAIAMSLTSCSKDDYDDHDYHLEHVKVASAELPEEFNYGSTYQIDVTIELPNSCYSYYNQFDYIYKGAERLIYPIAHIDDGIACNPSITETVFSIPIQVLQHEPYVFKFYQGEDEEGKDMFLTIEVPVTN